MTQPVGSALLKCNDNGDGGGDDDGDNLLVKLIREEEEEQEGERERGKEYVSGTARYRQIGQTDSKCVLINSQRSRTEMTSWQLQLENNVS